MPRILKKSDRFLALAKKILHPHERPTLAQNYSKWQDQSRPERPDINRAQEWLAGRIAAKEAARKAWGAALVGFQDLRIVSDAHGRTSIVCEAHLGQSPESVTEQFGHLSISHDGDYVTATVLASPLHEDILAKLGDRKAEAEKKVASPSRQAKPDSDLESHVTTPFSADLGPEFDIKQL